MASSLVPFNNMLSADHSTTVMSILEFTAFWVLVGRLNMDLCYLLHAIGAVILGTISIWNGNVTADDWLENLLVRYSFGYFLGHGMEMLRQGKATPIFLFHHLLALTLLFGVLTNPEFIQLKATSGVLLTEFSTLFLYTWEQYPSEAALGAFVATYFVSRGVYLGYFIWRIFFTADPEDVASLVPVGAFHYFTLLLFVLNMLYFSAILVPSVPGHLKRLRESKVTVTVEALKQ